MLKADLKMLHCFLSSIWNKANNLGNTVVGLEGLEDNIGPRTMNNKVRPLMFKANNKCNKVHPHLLFKANNHLSNWKSKVGFGKRNQLQLLLLPLEALTKTQHCCLAQLLRLFPMPFVSKTAVVQIGSKGKRNQAGHILCMSHSRSSIPTLIFLWRLLRLLHLV